MKMDQRGVESSEDLKRRHDEIKLRFLRKIVSLSENRQCFDCLQKGPTYVNATIGSFVCTKCSGLLRGLTPPHRVKSISMATFSVQEIELLKFRGNSYCKEVWLGLCDDNRITEPKNELEIKEFMIEKYEKKRFYLEPSPDRTAIPHMNGLIKADTSPVNGVVLNHINNYNRTQHHLSTQNLSEPEDIISLSNSSSMKKSTTSDDSLFFDQFNGGKSLNSALSIDNILSLSSFSSSSLATNDNSSNEFNADFANADIFVSPQLSAAPSHELINCSNNGHYKEDDSDVFSTNYAHDTDYTTRNGTKSLINSTSTNDDSNSNSSEDKYAALKDLDLKFKQKQDQMQSNWNFSQNSTTLFSTAPTITSTIPSSFELSLNSNNISNICSDNKSRPKNPFWQEENNPFRATVQNNHFQQPSNGFCDNFSNSNQVQSFLTYSQSLDFKPITNPNPFNIDLSHVSHKNNPFL